MTLIQRTKDLREGIFEALSTAAAVTRRGQHPHTYSAIYYKQQSDQQQQIQITLSKWHMANVGSLVGAYIA